MDADRAPETATREANLAPGASGASAEPFRLLLVVSTPDASQAFEFGAQRTLSLGRSAPADIRLDDPSLSRLHARFTREGESVRVTDLGSRNGTWLQGERVKDVLLRGGDCVVVGSATVSVQLATSARTALLGLLSSGTILQRIDEEWQRAQAFRRVFSVLAVRALRKGELREEQLAQACEDKLRPVDRAGLYDRSSLLVLLPEASAEEAARVAGELCAPLPGRGQLVAGVASYPDAGTTSEQLVSAAFDSVRACNERKAIAVAPRAQHVRDSQPEAPVDVSVRKSAAMLELGRMIERIAPRQISVLVTGETGTGKELVAHELHERSTRKSAPLKVVNCAAIPQNLIESVLFGHEKGAFTGADREHPGVFEQAHGGTVFLDEVGELSAETQAALLRVLDSSRLTRVGGQKEIAVDVRVVAATHRDLARMAEAGAFRLDLYHRLNGITLQLPPLRERVDEIEALASHFLARSAERWGGAPYTLDREAMALLMAYRWPGNVRELRNVIERAIALADGHVITSAELPAHLRAPATVPTQPPPPAASRNAEETVVDLRSSLLDHEAKLIEDALRVSAGNQRKAAELLSIPLRTFQRRLQQLGVSRGKDKASDE